MGALYQITFPNGKSYIGITRGTADRRLAVHWYQRRQRTYAVYLAINKYGIDSAKVTTLAIADWSYLKNLEPRAIDAFGTKCPHGYNMTDGGEVPLGLTAESLAKMSATHKGNGYRCGAVLSAETRAKIGAGNRGKKQSDAARALIGAASRGNKYNLGRKATPETRAKMAAAQMGRLGSNNKSGISGVTWDAKNGKWRAHITVNHKMMDLGRFTDINDAALARQRAVARLIGGAQ